jgi:hypothetical protein
MWFDRVRNLLEAVSSWLKTTDEEEIWWKLKTQVVQMCLAELTTILEKRAPIGHDPVSDDLNRAIARLQEMVDAMNKRDRTAALEAGNGVLAALEIAEPNLATIHPNTRMRRERPVMTPWNRVTEVA